MVCKKQYPIEIFGLEGQNGGIQQTTIAIPMTLMIRTFLIGKETLHGYVFTLYEPMGHYLNCKTEFSHTKLINVTNFGNSGLFDSTDK